MLSETRNIISHICSNWTKVALIYHYVNHASWQRSPTVQKCIAFVFRYCRCKLVKSWKDKMNQCSILELHPRKTTTLNLGCLLRLHGRKKKIKIPRAVMSSIFQALKEGLTVKQDIITQKVWCLQILLIKAAPLCLSELSCLHCSTKIFCVFCSVAHSATVISHFRLRP